MKVLRPPFPFMTTLTGHFAMFNGISKDLTHQIYFATEGRFRDNIFMPIIGRITEKLARPLYSKRHKI